MKLLLLFLDLLFAQMKLALLSALATVGSARRGGHGAGPYLQNPCLNSTFKSAKFCDATVGIDERAADIVQRLSIVEKIDALGTNTGPLPSVGLPAYNWWSEATHGISHVRDGPGSSTPYETNFALPIVRSLPRLLRCFALLFGAHSFASADDRRLVQPLRLEGDRARDRRGGAGVHERGQRLLHVLGSGDQSRSR